MFYGEHNTIVILTILLARDIIISSKNTVAKVGRGNSGHSSGLANLFLLCSGKKELQQKLTLLTSTLVYVVYMYQILSCMHAWFSLKSQRQGTHSN